MRSSSRWRPSSDPADKTKAGRLSGSCPALVPSVGHSRYAAHLRTASVTLCPPNPNEFDSATSTRRSTFRFGAQSRSQPRIGIELVDGRRNDPARGAEEGDRELERARGAEQMPGHGLGRPEHQLARLLAEHRLHRLGLRDVALLRRGAVRVDVAHVLRIDVGRPRGTRAWRAGRPRRSRAGDVMW